MWWWLACVGGVEDPGSNATAPTVEAAPLGAPPAPVLPPLEAKVSVAWAWPANAGGYAVSPGNWLRTTGIFAPTGTACGVDPGGFVFAAVTAPPTTVTEPPPNQAATLERGAWRLSDALGPREGIVPGLSGTEQPARQLGMNVRSLRKTRRPNGPPVYIGVASRDGKVVVALVDAQLEKVLASDVFAWDSAATLEVSPVLDVDGDGQLELFVGADDPKASLRASWRVDLATARLARASLETSPPKACP
jgi:hypothetical protein